MQNHRGSITDAEVLSVGSGIDEATAQPVICLTLRPITGSGWGCINYSLTIENARSLLSRLTRVFQTSPSINDERIGNGHQDEDRPTRP